MKLFINDIAYKFKSREMLYVKKGFQHDDQEDNTGQYSALSRDHAVMLLSELSFWFII